MKWKCKDLAELHTLRCIQSAFFFFNHSCSYFSKSRVSSTFLFFTFKVDHEPAGNEPFFLLLFFIAKSSYHSVFSLLLFSLFLHLPSVWLNVFPWWGLQLQMRWLQHLIWVQLLWSGRIFTCQDRLLLQYSFFLPPLIYITSSFFSLSASFPFILKQLACSLFCLPLLWLY